MSEETSGEDKGAGEGQQGGESGKTTTTENTSWTEGLTDEQKGLIEVKKFASPGDIIDSYRSLEKYLGAPKDKIIKIPDMKEEGARDEFYNKLGRPTKASEYELPFTEDADDSMKEKLSALLHKAGSSQDSAHTIIEGLNEISKANVEILEAKQKEALDGQEQALKKEWGTKYEENVAMSKKAATGLGIGDEQLKSLEAAMGVDGAMKFLHGIGSKISEGSFVQGGKVSSKQSALEQMTQLKRDGAFMKKVIKGDYEAKIKWQRLQEEAFA